MKLLMHLSALPVAAHYRHFGDLAASQREGEHFAVSLMRRAGARVAVLAPHGGRIEDGTSEIAQAIAGEDHHLYLLEGRRPSHNYHTLHLTSHRFDEPRCLELLAESDHVVAVHGCRGSHETVYIGGRDSVLAAHIGSRLEAADIPFETHGHPFPGRHPENVCNRGRRGAGVQLEITHPLRRSRRAECLARAVRHALNDILGDYAKAEPA